MNKPVVITLAFLIFFGTVTQVDALWFDDNTKKLEEDYKKLETKYKKLQSEYEKIKKELKKLKDNYSKIEATNKRLNESIKTTMSTIEQLNKQLERNALDAEKDIKNRQLQIFLNDLKNEREPLTFIHDQKINWRVSDSKGNVYNWGMPIETYENLVRYQPYETLELSNQETGEIYRVQNNMIFVGKSFTNVIDEVYDNSRDDADFVYEIWYIVSQITTYSYDLDDDPRWALETLSRNGGDCEDTSILIADMLKSSKHTKNWKIELVYFDSNNPRHPKTVNHVAVVVDDGKYNYILESTAKDDPYKWPNGISGWNFRV